MMNICINQHSESTSYDEHLYQQINLNQHPMMNICINKSESTSYDEHLYQQINQIILNQHPSYDEHLYQQFLNQHPMMNICINKSIL